MKNAAAFRGNRRLSARFTLSGNRQGALLRLAGTPNLTTALLFFLCLAVPANARPEIGPTSSANISISVSIAPKFELRATESRRSFEAGTPSEPLFCIATNGKSVALPILLVRAKAGNEALQVVEEGEPLTWCDAGNLARPGTAPTSGGAQMVFVFPE